MKDKKAKIFKSGKELFSARGFKDTNVSDITAKAGIGVGTFYNYYPSKEKLFLEIFLEENVKLKKRMLEAVDEEDEPLQAVKKMMAMNMAGIQSSPILREWFNKDVFGRIEQLYREENGIGAVGFMYDHIVSLVEKWQADGKMRDDIEPGMIMALIAAIINADTHKEEIGIEFFPRIMDYLAEFVLKGLTAADE